MPTTNAKRKEILFDPNTPVILSLAYPDGKEFTSKHDGGKRYMFSTTDNRMFFCGEVLRTIIVGLNVKKDQLIQICKRESRIKGEKYPRVEWQVYQVDQVGKILTRPAAAASSYPLSQFTPTSESNKSQTPAEHGVPGPPGCDDCTESKPLVTPARSAALTNANPGNGTAASAQTEAAQRKEQLLKRLKNDMSSALKIAVASAHNAEEYAKELGHIGDNGSPLKFCNLSIQKIASSVFIELSMRTRNSGL